MMDFCAIDERLGGALQELKRFSIVYLVASIVYFVIFFLSGITSETLLYFQYAEAMADGKMPYSDFNAEYPPAGMLILFIPRLFSFNAATYQIAFGVMIYVAMLFGAYFIYRMAEERVSKPHMYSIAYLIFTLMLFEFVMDRYDAIPMVLALGSIYYLTHNKNRTAWVLIVLAAAAKLYPAVLIPIFLIWLINKKETNKAIQGLCICVLVTVLFMIPFLIADASSALSFITYHSERGLETESIVASFIMMLSLLGLTKIGYEYSYGSDNIFGSLPDALANYMVPLMAVCLIILYVVFAYILKKERDDADCAPLIMACFTATLVFMTVNKVLSIQYFVWIIPYAVFMMMFVPSNIKTGTAYVFASLLLISQLHVVINYGLRGAGEPYTSVGIIVLLIRNIILTLFFLFIIRLGLDRINHPVDS